MAYFSAGELLLLRREEVEAYTFKWMMSDHLPPHNEELGEREGRAVVYVREFYLAAEDLLKVLRFESGTPFRDTVGHGLTEHYDKWMDASPQGERIAYVLDRAYMSYLVAPPGVAPPRLDEDSPGAMRKALEGLDRSWDWARYAERTAEDALQTWTWESVPQAYAVVAALYVLAVVNPDGAIINPDGRPRFRPLPRMHPNEIFEAWQGA